jgi:hypothetical protein
MIFIKENTDSNIIINLAHVISFRMPANTIPNSKLEIRFRILNDVEAVFFYNTENERKNAVKSISKILEKNKFGIYIL